jgi:hypothetical protein
MGDAFVRLLNGYGYQPVFLPRTGLVPPELYDFVRPRLVRRGPLSDYIKEVAGFPVSSGELGNLDGKLTSGKNFGAAVDFLKQALAMLGIDAIPKVDLSFTGAKEFVFSFSDVKFQEVNPSKLDQVLQSLKTPPAIPDEYVDKGGLHIIYQYAYASTLRMSRADGRKFDTDISGNVGNYIDVGAKATVESQANTVISFSGKNGKVAAFAYKAGQLRRIESMRWTFAPEVIKREGEPSKTAPSDMVPIYIPTPGIVNKVDDF